MPGIMKDAGKVAIALMKDAGKVAIALLHGGVREACAREISRAVSEAHTCSCMQNPPHKWPC